MCSFFSFLPASTAWKIEQLDFSQIKKKQITSQDYNKNFIAEDLDN